MDFSFVTDDDKPGSSKQSNGRSQPSAVVRIPTYKEVQQAEAPSTQPVLFRPSSSTPLRTSGQQPSPPSQPTVSAPNHQNAAIPHEMFSNSHRGSFQRNPSAAAIRDPSSATHHAGPSSAAQVYPSGSTQWAQQHGQGAARAGGPPAHAPAPPVSQPQATAGPSTAAMMAASSAAIIVSRRQQGNPVLRHIRNVRWQFGDIIPDYQCGQSTCALFLSLRYHLLHPDYIMVRIKQLQRTFRLTVLLCHVDVEDVVKPLGHIMKAASLNDTTLICAWSHEECARYLETLKSYESKPASGIQERVEADYLSRLTSALTSVRGVNKTDAYTLGTNFGSLAGVISASKEQLAACPGIGPTKVQRLWEAFNEPFRRTVRPAVNPDQAAAAASNASVPTTAETARLHVAAAAAAAAAGQAAGFRGFSSTGGEESQTAISMHKPHSSVALQVSAALMQGQPNLGGEHIQADPIACTQSEKGVETGAAGEPGEPGIPQELGVDVLSQLQMMDAAEDEADESDIDEG